MASQEVSSQLDSTPAMVADAHMFKPDPNTVCRLMPFDDNRSGALPGEVTMIIGDTVTFGRNKECTHKLNDSYVSGCHCKVWHDKKRNELWIKDYSSNGTFIDGRRIGKGNTTTLVNGNRITFSRPQIGYTVESYLDIREEEVLADMYHFRGELGRGAFSIVKKATSVRDGVLCAVKIINKAKLFGDPKSEEQVAREIVILKSVRHPNIIGYMDCIDTASRLYIVLEFADGGELFDHIVKKGAFPEEDAKTIMLQLLQGVSYLHSLGIAHRDLKPENILVHEGRIKITDFGLAKLSTNKSYMKTLCGTPQYVAPEIITMASQVENETAAAEAAAASGAEEGEGGVSSSNANAMNQDPPANGNASGVKLEGYTTAVDMWSLGVILYLLLTGRQPFSAETNRTLSLYSQIENVVYAWPHLNEGLAISEQAQDLVRRLLQKRPEDRLTADEALQHPWLESAIEYQTASQEAYETASSQSKQAAAAEAASLEFAPHEEPFSHLSPAQPSTSNPSSSMPVGAQEASEAAFRTPMMAEEYAQTPSSKKRPYHSLDEAARPPILPSNSRPIKDRRRGAGYHTAQQQHNRSSAMDADSSSPPSIAYGASAAYIDANVKRRKLNEGQRQY